MDPHIYDVGRFLYPTPPTRERDVGGRGGEAGTGERKTDGDATPLASPIRGVFELSGGKYDIAHIGLDTVEPSIFGRSPHLVFVPACRGSTR